MRPITKLTRITYVPKFIKMDFMRYDAAFRKARESVGEPIHSCFKCGNKFAENEQMALVMFEKGENALVCQGCGVFISDEKGTK